MTVSTLLTAVEEVCIVLSDLSRVLGTDLVDSFLKVALSCDLGLLGGVQGTSLGGGTALVGRSKTLSIGRNTILGRLGLTSSTSLARLQVVGVFRCDGAGVLLHLAEDILGGTFEVLKGMLAFAEHIHRRLNEPESCQPRSASERTESP